MDIDTFYRGLERLGCSGHFLQGRCRQGRCLSRLGGCTFWVGGSFLLCEFNF